MDRPHRGWKLLLHVEGDTWEAMGKAFSKALHVLMQGDPKEVKDKPETIQMNLDTGSFSLEITHDPEMTPEKYKDLIEAWREATGAA